MTLPLHRIVLALGAIAYINPATAAMEDPAAKPSFAEPSFSPDRREIVFSSGGDLWTVASAGGEARLLVSHPATERRPFF